MDSIRHSRGMANADKWDYWHHTWEVDAQGKALDPLMNKLCSHLQGLTGSAKVITNHDLVFDCEECMGSRVADIGFAEIGNSPIELISAAMNGNEWLWGEINFGVPDDRNLEMVGIRTEAIKRFPLFGRVVDIRWVVTKWDFLGSREYAKRVSDNLSSDQNIKEAVIATQTIDDDVVIRACYRHNFWWINALWKDPEHPVSREKWACYEMIARRLLEVPLDQSLICHRGKEW